MQLQNDPKCTQILRNIPKHYFRVNGVDWDCPLQRIPTSLRGTNFCINCTSSPRFAPSSCSYETIPNAPKYYKGPMGWIGCVCCKKSRRHFKARTLALIAPIHPILQRVSCSYEMIPNAPKHYETH